MRLSQLLSGLWILAPALEAQIALLTAHDHPPVTQVTQAMEGELTALFAGAGSAVVIHADGPLVYLGAPRHVLYVAFRGRCEFVPQIAPRTGQRIMASLAVVDGRIQPMMTVDCDAVAQTIAGHMTRADLKHAEFVYGRALARVVAHEIYHWVAHQTNHRHSELFSETMGARTLLAERARFEPGEVQLLRVNR